MYEDKVLHFIFQWKKNQEMARQVETTTLYTLQESVVI